MNSRIGQLLPSLLLMAVLLVAGRYAPGLRGEDPPGTPVRVERAAEVVQGWSPGRSLYIKGDVGVGDLQTRELATWLQRFPNWTVFLTDKAEGESYTDADGHRYSHHEAVEHLLGKELPNRTGFGSHVDARTGKRNGAVLYISFDRNRKYRKIGYFGSQVYDDYELGEAHWKGKLDRHAIAALKNGRRVLDAVKDSITAIEKRLTAAIEREDEARERFLQMARVNISKAIASVESLKEDLKRFSAKYPDATKDDIARPDLGALEVQLATAQSALLRDDTSAVLRQISVVNESTSAHARALKRYAGAEGDLEKIETRLHELRGTEHPSRIRSRVEESIQALDLVRQAWRRGDSSYLQALELLADEVRTLHSLISVELPRFSDRLGQFDGRLQNLTDDRHVARARPALQTATAALRELRQSYEDGVIPGERSFDLVERELVRAASQVREAAAAGTFWRFVRSVFGGAVGLIVLIGLVLLNRRSRRHGRRAFELYTRWDELLTAKTLRLWELEGKKDRILGPRGKGSAFTGETADIARRARRIIGQLFVMRFLARRHHASAAPFVQPASFAGRLKNHFFAGNFEKAIRRLSEEQIEYDRSTGLEEIIREQDGERVVVDLLSADLEDVQPFTLSFEELIEEFNLRAGEALEALDEIESSTENVISLLSETRQKRQNSGKLAAELRDASRDDSPFPLFELPALGSDFFPTIDASLEEAQEKSTDDPIRAVAILADVSRTTELANESARVLLDARERHLPRIRQAEAALRAADRAAVSDLDTAGLELAWIGVRLREISDASNRFVEALTSPNAEPGSPDLAGRLQTLVVDSERAGELDAKRRTAAFEAVSGLQSRLQRARAAIATSLALTPEEVLHETAADPTKFLEKAKSHHGLLAGALAGGDLDKAERVLSQVFNFSGRGNEIIDRTRSAFESHEETTGDLRKGIERLGAELLRQEQVLEELRRDFAPEALRLRSGDTDYPDANETVQDNLDESRQGLEEADALIETAQELFQRACILEAADKLERSGGFQRFVEYRFAEITDKRSRILATVRENAEAVERLDQELRELSSEIADRRIRQPNRDLHGELCGRLETARRLHGGSPGIPFQTAECVEAVRKGVEEIRSHLANDRTLYRELELTIASTRSRLEEAAREAVRAAGDAIPDSDATLGASERIRAQLRPRFDELLRAFAVDHGNWDEMDTRAQELGGEASRQLNIIRQEIEEGEHAIAEFESARRAVRSMQTWIGSHGIQIFESPGAGIFRLARAALERGDYDQADALARRARSAAERAVAKAERSVARKEAEEARRRARARARAARGRSTSSFLSSISSSSGSSGGFSSSSFSSGSSGFSSSSFSGSSSSGFSSSSW